MAIAGILGQQIVQEVFDFRSRKVFIVYINFCLRDDGSNSSGAFQPQSIPPWLINSGRYLPPELPEFKRTGPDVVLTKPLNGQFQVRSNLGHFGAAYATRMQ